jgi:hypothetical protein
MKKECGKLIHLGISLPPSLSPLTSNGTSVPARPASLRGELSRRIGNKGCLLRIRLAGLLALVKTKDVWIRRCEGRAAIHNPRNTWILPI